MALPPRRRVRTCNRRAPLFSIWDWLFGTAKMLENEPSPRLGFPA
jgi:hypothetical protein